MKRQSARIIRHERVAEETYRLYLQTDGKNDRMFFPGKFVHIGLTHDLQLPLRRPFGIAGYKDGVLSVIYHVQGKGTSRLSQYAVGQELDLLGPLGNGFFLKPADKKVWLAGGGLGVAPLLHVPEYYPDREYKAFFGFRSKAHAYGIEEANAFPGKAYFVSDDGSFERKGFVTDALKERLLEERPDIILSCGPMPMFKALKNALEGYDIPCKVAMEQRMGCGVGACMTCVCMTDQGKYKRVCMDGPVFDMKEVVL